MQCLSSEEFKYTEILHLNVLGFHYVLSLRLFSIWVYGLKRVTKIYPNIRLAKYIGDTPDFWRILSLFHFRICTKFFLVWTKVTYRLVHGYAFSFDCFLCSWSKTTEINWKTLVLQPFICNEVKRTKQSPPSHEIQSLHMQSPL